ncbi:MAG: hypothetical protein AABX29_03575 [Nanoarchaeota archaeon]
MDEAGYQQLSKEDARKLGRKCFLLGLCIFPECRTAICADNYTDSGERFEGRRLLFRPDLEFVLN